MNERIEKLAEQCYVKTGSEHTDHFAYWKFAELIVQDCIDWCNAHAAIEGTAQKIVESIKEHFGVEE